MKKTLWTLAATLALVGCSEKELINVDDGQLQSGNAIAFSTYVGDNAQTRASVIEIDDLRLNGFGVNAYYTGTESFSAEESYSGNAIFMNNTKVTFNPNKGTEGEWTYSPVKYWPNNVKEMLSFFAYAPYNSNQISFLDENNKSKLSFAVDADVKNQVDLIYHPADGNITGCEKTMNLEKPSVNSKVNFNFQHALSRITFDVKAVVDEATEGDNLLDGNTRINIKKVMLVNATMSESEDEIQVEAEKGPFYTTASLDLQTGTWSERNGEQPFLLDDDHFYRGVKVDGVDVVQLTKFNPAQPLLNEDSYLMIIPQDFSETGDTPDGYRIYIEYDVISEEVNNNGSSENTTNDSNTITNKIYSNVMNTTFEAGKAYKFTLLLGMTSVKFTADVDDWDNATGYDDEEWLPENIPFTVDENGNFLIQTAEELATFRNLISNGSSYVDENGTEKKYANASYLQTADIDLSLILGEDGYWVPIGHGVGDSPSNPTQFKGTYDGDGHTVSNVRIHNNNSGAYMSGLFYKVQNATIRNLHVDGQFDNIWAADIGGVVGYALSTSTIENCHFSGSISIRTGASQTRNIGGVVGYITGGTVKACSSSATITVGAGTSSSDNIGGVVGSASSVPVIGCYNTGDIYVSTNSNKVGGIVGNATAAVTSCYNTGTITIGESATGNSVGSIIASGSGTPSYCYYTTTNVAVNSKEDSSFTSVKNVSSDELLSTVVPWLNYGLNGTETTAGYEYYVESSSLKIRVGNNEGEVPPTEEPTEDESGSDDGSEDGDQPTE